MTKRIAIYARFSSDMQNKLSCVDQIHICKDYIKSTFDDYEIVAIKNDDALTGKFIHNRANFNKLLEMASDKKFDVLVAESLDRISRGFSDMPKIYEYLEFCNIKINTIVESEVTAIVAGLKGTMNAIYLQDLRQKVKRGQEAKARRGEYQAGVAYGYKINHYIDKKSGKSVVGKRQIDHEKAKIVKYIFNTFIKGVSLCQIAKNLNEMGVPSPKGKQWNIKAIAGAKERNEGILNNPIYKGELVYNISTKVTNPVSLKTTYVINPIEDRIITHDDDYRIVSNDLWDKVKTEQAKRYVKNDNGVVREVKPLERAKVKPLTELVVCGSCGGRKTVANKKRYVCDNYRHRRSCKNARGEKEPDILEQLIIELTNFAKRIDDWKSHFEIVMIDEIQNKNNLELQNRKLHKEKENYLDAIRDKVVGAKQRARDCEADIADIEEKLALIRSVPNSYKNMDNIIIDVINQIPENFFNPYYALPLSNLLSSIVDDIVLTPKNERRGETIKITLKDNWVNFYYQAKKIGFIE